MRASQHGLPRVFRRQSLFFALMTLGYLQFVAPVRSEETPTGKFKGVARVQGNLGQASLFSDDKKAATLLFDNFVTAVDGTSQRLVVTQSQTFLIPLQSDPEKETRLALRIFGFVSTIGNTRTVLMVQAGGKTRVVDLEEASLKAQRNMTIQEIISPAQPANTPTAVSAEQRAQVRAAAKQQVPAPLAMVAEDFVFDMDFKVPPNGKNPITITVLAERDFDTPEHQGFLAIDSLDVEVTDPIRLPPVPATPPS